jgi:ferredoxin
MKRIFLFLATNLAVLVVLSIVARLLGIDRYLTAQGGNLGGLLAFAALFGFGGALISLAMSKWMAKRAMGVRVITTPANHFMVSLQPAGYIEPIRDFETAESFGVGKLEEFTKKQIFDADACTRCGRCQDGCPAYLSGKPLSPKKLLQDLKTFWLEQAPIAIAAQRAAAAPGDEGNTGKKNQIAKVLDRVDALVDTVVKGATRESAPVERALVGNVVDLHELWACTNCLYCQENCSASIEHVPKIVGMRQYKVLTEADFAPELQLTFRNTQKCPAHHLAFVTGIIESKGKQRVIKRVQPDEPHKIFFECGKLGANNWKKRTYAIIEKP